MHHSQKDRPLSRPVQRFAIPDPERKNQSLVCLLTPRPGDPGVYFCRIVLRKNGKNVRTMWDGFFRDTDQRFLEKKGHR